MEFQKVKKYPKSKTNTIGQIQPVSSTKEEAKVELKEPEPSLPEQPAEEEPTEEQSENECSETGTEAEENEDAAPQIEKRDAEMNTEKSVRNVKGRPRKYPKDDEGKTIKPKKEKVGYVCTPARKAHLDKLAEIRKQNKIKRDAAKAEKLTEDYAQKMISKNDIQTMKRIKEHINEYELKNGSIDKPSKPSRRKKEESSSDESSEEERHLQKNRVKSKVKQIEMRQPQRPPMPQIIFD